MAALALALCFVFNMAGRGLGDAYTVFLLPLSAEFQWTRGQATSVFSTYLLATGLAGPITGWAFDRWGPRVVYPVGVVCIGGSWALAASLAHLWQFQLVIGVLCGIGVSALGMVPASSLVSRWFRANMSTAMAVVYAAFGAGAIAIIPLAQYLIEAQGWRDTYRLLGLIVLATLPLLALVPWKRIGAGHPDYARPASAAGAPSGTPLREAVRSPAFWLLTQVFFFTSLGMYTITVQTVALLVDAGFAPLEAATAYGVTGLLSVAGMTFAGWCADRLGYRPTATATFVGSVIGIVALLALSYRPSQWLLAAFVLPFGICQGARGPLIASLCARIFPGTGFATIYGTIFACASIGMALGSWMSGVLHDITGGYQVGIYFSIGCIFLAAMPFWVSDRLAWRRSPSVL
jgi:MFS family permease